jgi:hypothetical protein
MGGINLKHNMYIITEERGTIVTHSEHQLLLTPRMPIEVVCDVVDPAIHHGPGIILSIVECNLVLLNRIVTSAGV